MDNGKWQVILRAKKSPYVRSYEKRNKRKLRVETRAIVVSGTNLDTRQAVSQFIKKAYDWAVVVSLKKMR